MYKKLVTVLLLGVVCLSFAACNKDSEINSVMADIHTVTDEVVKKIEASPTVEGVDDAQKYWDSKKADLQKKWDGIKDARGFQVGKEAKANMEESFKKDYTALKMLEVKHMDVTTTNEAFKSKLEALVKEWEGMFGVK